MEEELPELPAPALTHDRDLRPLLIGPTFTADQMRAYARQAVLMERERCAKLCEWFAGDDLPGPVYGRTVRLAAAIRGQT